MIRDQIILEKKYNSIGLKCFACKQNSHITLDCPYLHFIPDRLRTIKIHTCDPQQKERKKYSRKPYKSLNALTFKNPIRISYLRFKDFLKKYYIMEEDFMSECSESLSEISENEIKNYEKIPKSIKTFEESKVSSMNNFPSLNFEKPFISINRLNDYDSGESMKEIKMGKPLISITKINESEEIDIEELKEENIKGHFQLSIDTNSSKSKNIMNKINKRSNSSQKCENDNNSSFKSLSKRRQFSKDSNAKNEGSMFFNYEGLELEKFQKKPNKDTQSIHSFTSFLPENKSCSKDQSVFSFSNSNEFDKNKPKNEAKNEAIIQKFNKQMSLFEETKNVAIVQKFNKQKSLMEPPQLKRLKSKKKHQSVVDHSKENDKISKKHSVEINTLRKKTKESTVLCSDSNNNLYEPVKTSSLKKFKMVDETDFLKSPLLKLPVYGDNPKLMEKRKKNEDLDEKNLEKIVEKNIEKNAENVSKKENIEVETELKFIEESELLFETVKNFKNYYPQNNVKEIIQIIANHRRKKSSKRNNKRRKTKKLQSFFSENPRLESRFSLNFNKVVPIVENNISESSARFSPKMQDRRASNIFLDRLETVHFFKKTNKFTFYDVVYEVINNKELRKHLSSLREKSYKNKIKTQFTNNHLI